MSRFRSCATADGVRPIAAFRGRSLDGLGLDGAVPDVVTGMDFWASPSDIITLGGSGSSSSVADGKDEECACCCVAPMCGGGLVSLTAGTAALAMELSGIPALRGGGGGTGSESSECGRYAVAVWSFRFDENWRGGPELKGRNMRGEVRKVEELQAIAVTLRIIWWGDGRGEAHRWMIMSRGGKRGGKSLL